MISFLSRGASPLVVLQVCSPRRPEILSGKAGRMPKAIPAATDGGSSGVIPAKRPLRNKHQTEAGIALLDNPRFRFAVRYRTTARLLPGYRVKYSLKRYPHKTKQREKPSDLEPFLRPGEFVAPMHGCITSSAQRCERGIAYPPFVRR